MNEGAKTGIFWCVAVVMVAIATFVAWPRSTETDTSKLIGKQLFPDFEDPLVAASMKIVTYDDEQGSLSQFEVVKDPQTGIWKMPTHAGYPADAEEQMRYSATALFDLSILDVPSRNAEDHSQFGVLEPDPEGLKVGDEGVGRMVDFRDDQGQKLATLVIGNEVPNAPQQRYVRKPTQDVVYVVELDPSRLSTRFVDWIDKDLLGLTSFDIDRVTLNNYTAAFDLGSGQVSHNKKFEAELKLDGADWNLEQLVTFKEGVGVPKPLGEDEVLNTEKLNQLKRALDDLEIAGVGRKPEGMSANLKADQSLTRDQNALVSLLQRGFIPVGSADSDQLDILAANGELVVTQKDGVEYVLRFGETAENSGRDLTGGAEGESAPSGSNRYLLVTARLNESQIPVPDLEESPETIEELDAKDDPAIEIQSEEDPAAQPPTALTEIPAEATDAEPADDEPADDEPADDDESMNAEEASTESTETGTESPGEEPNTDDAPEEEQPTADDDAVADADAPADSETPDDSEESASEDAESEEAESEESDSEVTESSAAEAADVEQVDEQESAEEVSTESSPADSESDSESDAGGDATDDPAQENEVEDAPAPEPDASESNAGAEDDADATSADGEPSDADTSDAESDEPAQPEETEQEKRERLEAAQERIAKENQRKLDEREEKIQQARQRVAELNARFADWYYEISEVTFSDLLLSQNDLIISEDEAVEQQEPAPGGLPQGFPQGGFPGGAAPQFGPPGGR